MKERLTQSYFEQLYADSSDPWNFETSEYERKKYQRTLEAIKGRTYSRTLEVGSSIGVFTRMLAPLCDELLAVDTSEKAVMIARERLADQAHVRVEQRTLPEEMPEGPFGLIVASEVLYYFPKKTMLQMLYELETALAAGGALLAVHWRKKTQTYPLQGDEVHELLVQNSRLKNTKTLVEPEYRLDLLEDRP